ncbi:MAG: hypothetical protein AAF703_12500 [Cyanobacteria bacterium P01_D01_bin.105]
MTILNQFMKLLECLEVAQEFILFLMQPAGLTVLVALCLFFSIQILYGCDSFTAATLSGTAALTLFCLLEEPDF